MLHVLELIDQMDDEFRMLCHYKLFNEWYEWLVLRKYIVDNNLNITKERLEGMIKFYNLPFEGCHCSALEQIKCQPNQNIPEMYDTRKIPKKFLLLLKNLSHTNHRSKQYQLLYDYFSKVKDKTAIKWSVNILIDNDKLKELFGEE